MADDLANGASMTVDGDIPVALFRTEDGEFFATEDSCTRGQWSLGEDSGLEGAEVVCPPHMARFGLRTGKALCFPAMVALRTFPVEAEDGRVFVHG